MVDGIVKIKVKRKYETSTSYNIPIDYIYTNGV